MKRIVTLILITWSMTMYAQKEANIWFFGDNAGIDFNGALPQPLSAGQTTSWDNTSCISDSAGNLLFYTDGETVWNKNHFIMNNGSGLNGSNMGGQCALIVPRPSSGLYYIFTVDIFAGAQGFNYHIVDMSQQAGLGSVVSKNNLLFSPSTEKIDAIYNPADNSYWVITHIWGNNHFYCYKITSAGLNINPVVSNIGSAYSGGIPSGYNSLGQMTFSKDGTKLVSTVYSDGLVEIFDFNMSTGQLSNPRLMSGFQNVLGAAFSQDASKLYIAIWKTDNVYQFDLSIDSVPVILGSATIIGHATSGSSTGYKAGYLQLGPDNKIYIARYEMNHLAVINNPNEAGANCYFVNNGFSLNNKVCFAGLCRVPVKIITTGDEDLLQATAHFSLFPNPACQQCSFHFPFMVPGETVLVSIANALGHNCQNNQIMPGGNHTVDISNLEQGCYFVSVQQKGKTLGSQKLIIQR